MFKFDEYVKVYFIYNIHKNKEYILDETDAKFLLESISSALHTYDIKFALGFGTALGAYRDNKFIEYDTDLDIILYDVYDIFISNMNEISDTLAKKNILLLRDNKDYLVSYYFNNVYIDLCFYTDIDREFAAVGKEIMSYKMPKIFLEFNKKIQFYGKEYFCPNKIEEYFKYFYGNDWKTPIKNFHANW